MTRKKILGFIILGVLFVAKFLFPVQFQNITQFLDQKNPSDLAVDSTSTKEPGLQARHVKFASDFSRLKHAIAHKESEVWLEELPYKVIKTLPDDNKGSRHQRFLVSPENTDLGTLLIAHNIDLSDYIPLSRNEVVWIKGRFEWNEKGGVIHWTHHDPNGYIKGGWIKHQGKKYQ